MNSIRSVTLLPMAKCWSVPLFFSLWETPAEFLREEWCAARVAFVSPHADSLHQLLQKLIKILQQVIMKYVKLVGLALILCIQLFHSPGAGVCGPGRISALVQLGWSISGTKSRPDLHRPWYSSGSITKWGYWAPAAQPCPLQVAKNTIPPLLPTQPLAKSPPRITWLARCSWINFLLSTASWGFHIPEGTLPH